MTREEIACAWRGEVVSTLPWRPADEQPEVESGDLKGFAVVAEGFPGRGFLKPGVRLPDADRKCHAAREKIAADLAFDLSLPVPPAILWRRPGQPTHVETQVVVSQFVYPEDVKWFMVEYGNVRPVVLSSDEAAEILRRASGMLAFDTWVDQHEHAPLLHRHLDPARLEEVIRSIEVLPDSHIHEIVERIPDDFLPRAEKAMLEAALLGRRVLIRPALEGFLRADKR